MTELRREHDRHKPAQRIRINWITMQGNPVELYGGPYPIDAQIKYVRP